MKHELPKHSARTLITNRRVVWRVRTTKLQNKAYYIRQVCLSVCMTACKSTGQVTIKVFLQFLEALWIRSRVSYVGTATTLRVGWPRYQSWIPSKSNRFPYTRRQLLRDNGYGVSPGDESAEVWADRSPTFHADINNTRIFTSNPPHVFIA